MIRREKRKQRSMRRREKLKYIAMGTVMTVAIYSALIIRIIRERGQHEQVL